MNGNRKAGKRRSETGNETAKGGKRIVKKQKLKGGRRTREARGQERILYGFIWSKKEEE